MYYGIGINPWMRKETLPATGATATQNGSSWTMKSGYGLSLYDCNVMIGVTGYESPAYGSGFTVPQYSYALFPEYNYQNAAGKITTLQSKSIGNYRFWIYGSCLDGTDQCVRLEGYMRGENAWKIDRCYMKKGRL